MSFKIKLPRSKFPGTLETDGDALGMPTSVPAPTVMSNTVGQNSATFNIETRLNEPDHTNSIDIDVLDSGSTGYDNVRPRAGRNDTLLSYNPTSLVNSVGGMRSMTHNTSSFPEEETDDTNSLTHIEDKDIHISRNQSHVVYLGHLVYEPRMKLPSYKDNEYESFVHEYSQIQTLEVSYRWTIYVAACYLTMKCVIGDDPKYQSAEDNDNVQLLTLLYRSARNIFVDESVNMEKYRTYDLRVILEQKISRKPLQYSILQIDKMEFGEAIMRDRALRKCKISCDSLFNRVINVDSPDAMILPLSTFQIHAVFDASGSPAFKYSPRGFFEYILFLEHGQMGGYQWNVDSKDGKYLRPYNRLVDSLKCILTKHSVVFETFDGSQFQLSIEDSHKGHKNDGVLLNFSQKIQKRASKPQKMPPIRGIRFEDIEWTEKSIVISGIEYGPIKLFRISKVV